MSKKRYQGVSLFELLIVLAIIGILATMSITAYSHYFAKAKRLEAEITLSKLALALEEYYGIHHTYKDATLSALGFNEIIAENRYALSMTLNDGDFLLTANPLNDQITLDTNCGTLSLNSQGEKGNSGASNYKECW